jgi:FkbM family methyltransferase
MKRILIALRAIFGIKNFWSYFRIRFFPNGRPCELDFRNGAKVIAGPEASSISIINEVFFYQDYLHYYHGETPHTVIDIGANIGYFTVFAKTCFPKARVIAFEPFEKSFLRLKEHISLNGFVNVQAINKAVGKATGSTQLFLAGDSGENSIVRGNSATSKAVTVETISFEDVFREFKIESCDFLKVDCEGAEYDIFYGLPESLFPRIKHIAMETHFIDSESRNREALNSFLTSKGFLVLNVDLGSCPYLFASSKCASQGHSD